MRTARSSSRLCGVCLSACWDTPPGVWAWRHPPPSVGLETTPGVSLETSPGQTPQLPPWVWGGEPCQTPQLAPWVWAWRPARHAGIPPAMHAGIPPPSVDIIILTHKIRYRIISKPAQHYLFCTVKLNQKLLLHEESKKYVSLKQVHILSQETRL